MIEVRRYVTREGRSPFRDWFLSLDFGVRARVRARLARLRAGLEGDAKSVSGPVRELRFHFGPGYRVYFAWDGQSLVVLLVGGDKSSQSRDIGKAVSFWDDYLRRRSHEAL